MAFSPSSTSQADSPYDYIIVGSGAGGAPLAARLAEYGHNVLVLEAGGDHTESDPEQPQREVSEVPCLHAKATEDPALSWKFFVDHYTHPVEPDPKSNSNGKLFYPRASGVGGCTIHNAMITVAGPPSDWDQLAWYLNDPSWAADVMRGYFQRLEKCEYYPPRERARGFWNRASSTMRWLFGLDEDVTSGRHGFSGWLRTSMSNVKLGLVDPQLMKMLEAAILTACKAGLERPLRFVRSVLHGDGREGLDPNHFRRLEQHPEGVVLIPLSVYGKDEKTRGHRSGPAKFLRETADKWKTSDNRLDIASDCLATKILFAPRDRSGKLRAIGVSYQHGEKLYRACPVPGTAGSETKQIHAKREVILCGGTFNTPQLLMLSGIGPGGPQTKEIDLLVKSPGVGKNLQDRYEVTVITKMPEPFSILNDATLSLPPAGGTADPLLQQWRKDGTGLYATNGSVLGIFRRSRPDLAQPDLFIYGFPLKFPGYQEGYSNVPMNEHNYFTWAILKAHTHNRGGEVTLKTSDPLDTPSINFKYFGDGSSRDEGDDRDLDALVEGVKFVRQIADNAGFGVSEFHPGRSYATEPQIKRWVEREAWGHHACGTCRMGRATDPMAVIDSHFRVLDSAPVDSPAERRSVVQGLRVVDASIFPRIPGYFIATNIYVCSEKAADVIHQDSFDSEKVRRA